MRAERPTRFLERGIGRVKVSIANRKSEFKAYSKFILYGCSPQLPKKSYVIGCGSDEMQFTVANTSTFSLGHDIVKDHILNLEHQL